MALSALSLSLLGGVAAASPGDREITHDRREITHDRREVARDHRELVRDQRELVRDRNELYRDEHFRNVRFRPSMRQERAEYRHGFVFIRGEWKWDGYEWTWIPGHYARTRGW